MICKRKFSLKPFISYVIIPFNQNKNIMKRKNRKGNGMSTTFAQNVVKGEDEIER